jgi:hypothetical protein
VDLGARAARSGASHLPKIVLSKIVGTQKPFAAFSR